jgi:hypothetical protein
MDQASLPPTTTHQEDQVTKGQRAINKIWEVTQAIIALSVTAAKIYTAIFQIESPDLTNAFFLVVSMYLVRTNHQLIGGVKSGDKGR